MQLFTGIEAFERAPHRPLVLTLGNFDGLHLGHQKILARVAELAKKTGAAAAALTFQQSPQRILNPDSPPPPLLLAPEHKLLLLEKMGMEVCFFLPFTETFSKIEAGFFVQDILLKHAGMKIMCLGYNAHFGHHRKGGPVLMRKLAREGGFDFEEIGPVEWNGEAISSSRIRKLILEGKMDEAAACLGRPFSLLGKVVRGDGRGQSLGFPTANLETQAEALPPHGVYPVRVREVRIQRKKIKEGQEDFSAQVSEVLRPGVLNYGVRPTFGKAQPVLEVHLLDFKGELYGKTLEVFFYPRLRAEKTFQGPEALKAQILRDINEVRNISSPRLGTFPRVPGL